MRTRAGGRYHQDDKLMLSREEILGKDDLKKIEVEVPVWGDTVTLQELNAEAAVELHEEMKRMKDDEDQRGIRELAIVVCAIGEDGERLFTRDDIALLKKKSNEAINLLGDAAWDLIGLGEDEEKEAVEN